jgi:excisionase family DNA binding protein
MEATQDRLPSIAIVTSATGVSQAYWRKAVRFGRIAVIRIGRRSLISTDDLHKFLDAACRTTRQLRDQAGVSEPMTGVQHLAGVLPHWFCMDGGLPGSRGPQPSLSIAEGRTGMSL